MTPDAPFADDGFTVYYDKYLQGKALFVHQHPNTGEIDRMDYALDKFGQLALMPVTHLDHEAAKNTYTIEVMDADAASELGVITVVITVTDVNEAPRGPSPALRSKLCRQIPRLSSKTRTVTWLPPPTGWWLRTPPLARLSETRLRRRTPTAATRSPTSLAAQTRHPSQSTRKLANL